MRSERLAHILRTVPESMADPQRLDGACEVPGGGRSVPGRFVAGLHRGRANSNRGWKGTANPEAWHREAWRHFSNDAMVNSRIKWIRLTRQREYDM